MAILAALPVGLEEGNSWEAGWAHKGAPNLFVDQTDTINQGFVGGVQWGRVGENVLISRAFNCGFDSGIAQHANTGNKTGRSHTLIIAMASPIGHTCFPQTALCQSSSVSPWPTETIIYKLYFGMAWPGGKPSSI